MAAKAPAASHQVAVPGVGVPAARRLRRVSDEVLAGLWQQHRHLGAAAMVMKIPEMRIILVCVCVYICIYTCIRVCVCVHIYITVHITIYTFIYSYIYIYRSIYIYVYIHTIICICTYIYIYTYAYVLNNST